MKRYFGQISFEFAAEDAATALDISNVFAGAIFNHPAVLFVYDELPEEAVYAREGDTNDA